MSVSASLLAGLLASVLRTDFPNLAGEDISLASAPLKGACFQAWVEPGSVLLGNRRYVIYFESRLLEEPPPTEALLAVLAHELAHVEDYSRRSASGMAALAVRYYASSRFRADYERSTDRRAVSRGRSAGLSAYRRWLYRRLPKEEPRLRREYLTPEELEPRKVTGL